ncbi:MAG: hypothetical protein IKR83_06055 [Bacteroidales bacterium]|nr:hypothetical protein [Bacteroidales bacterium]
MVEKKSKYLVWLETLHREYTDRACITQFGKQAASLRLLAEMYEVRCRFERILERMQQDVVTLEDEGLDYLEWISPEKWRKNEGVMAVEDMKETFGFSPTSPLAQTYANSMLAPFEQNANFNADNFRDVVSSLLVFDKIVDPQRMDVAIGNELRKMQEALINIYNTKQRTLSEDDYAKFYRTEFEQYKAAFITKATLEAKHKKWKDDLNEDITKEVLRERRVELLLDLFDSGFVDELKRNNHSKPKEDVMCFKDYDFEKWKDRMDEAVKYFDSLRKICPFENDIIDFRKAAKIGKYIITNHIEPATQRKFFECVELIRMVQGEMLKLDDPNSVNDEGNTPVELFVEKVKHIMLKAEDDNGTIKENTSRGNITTYTYNVDGKGFALVMDELLEKHEKELKEYLKGATTKTATNIKHVAPFIGVVIDTKLYTPQDMPKNAFQDVFEVVYGKGTSAVSKMSDKHPSDEAKKLYEIVREIIKKHKPSSTTRLAG